MSRLKSLLAALALLPVLTTWSVKAESLDPNTLEIPKAASPESQINETPFEFDYFQQLDPETEPERKRLCGLDKVCIELWKKGKLQIYKEGRLIEGDFNNDGIQEQAMILETDAANEQTGKDYWIHITQAQEQKAGSDATPAVGNAANSPAKADAETTPISHKVLFDEMIPDAFNVIDFSWDEKRKSLVIDIGERVYHGTTAMTVDPTQTLMVAQQGKTDKVLVFVGWNAKTNKFELTMPVKGQKHKKRPN